MLVAGSVVVLMTPELLETSREAPLIRKCRWRLSHIGSAAILYSTDYAYFPHMTAHDKENGSKEVSAVYRVFIFHKYLGSSDTFACGSGESFIRSSESVLDDPRKWTWGPAKSRPVTKRAKKPVLSVRDEPELSSNDELSYTWRKKVLKAADATADDLLAAHKCWPNPDKLEPRYLISLSSPRQPSHEDAISVVFADGRVEVAALDSPLSKRVQDELVMLGARPKLERESLLISTADATTLILFALVLLVMGSMLWYIWKSNRTASDAEPVS